MMASRTVMPSVRKVSALLLKLYTVTRVEESTTSLQFCRPIKAMNNPMPAETARLSGMGMELKMASRTLVRESAMKMRPSTNTAASAICQEYPMPPTTV